MTISFSHLQSSTRLRSCVYVLYMYIHNANDLLAASSHSCKVELGLCRINCACANLLSHVDWLAYARDVMCVGNTSWKLEFFYSCDWWFFSTATDADRRSYTQVTKKSATDLFPIIVAQAQLDPKKVVADWSVSSQCRPEGTLMHQCITHQRMMRLAFFVLLVQTVFFQK